MSQKKKTTKKTSMPSLQPGGEALTLKQSKQATLLGQIAVGIIVIIGLIIGVVVYVAKNPSAPEAPSFTTSDGGIVITKDGVQKDGRKYDDIGTKNVIKVVWDGICPGCADLDRTMKSDYKAYLGSGKVTMKEYPISIMDRASKDTLYSTRMAAAAYRLAELDPAHYLDFVHYIFKADVQPDEADFKGGSDAQIQKWAMKVGVSKDIASKITDGTYTDFVTRNTQVIAKDKSILRLSADGTRNLITPIIVANGYLLDGEDFNNSQAVVAKHLGYDKSPTKDAAEKSEK